MILAPDRGELDRFVRSLFQYADEGTFVAFRGFDQFRRDVPATLIRAAKVNGDLGSVVSAAFDCAATCANASSPIVFAPPVCTFSNPDRARGIDLANGIALSVEIDEGDTTSARARLEALIGPATIVMASGGVWADPNTGEVHPKLHLHWRLNEPTRVQDDHARLRMARDMAAQLAGGDPTGKPVVHPLRWAGSWNLKDKPRLAKIIGGDSAAEIDLTDALDRLQDAVEAAGLARASIPQSSDPTAPVGLVRAAMGAIPNPGKDVHYDDWIRMGYAVYRATGGGEDGYRIWDAWSQKSEKYDAAEQEAAWSRVHKAILAADVPAKVGAGTIFFLAGKAGWERPRAEPPPDETDPGWWESLERTIDWHPAQPQENVSQQRTAEVAELDSGGIIDPREWTAPAPLRQWLVEGWIPVGYATGLYGDGGLGKSLLGQQLLTSCATGLPWLGMPVKAGPAFGFMCEDDPDELWRRQEAINRQLGIRPEHLEWLRYTSRLGLDNILMTFDDRNRPELTALFKQLVVWLQTYRPRLIVLDTLADIFGGDEVKRAHARQFVQGVAGNLARAFDCAVVVPAHPSASGIATKSGTSGSTAWNNTFRSRLYLSASEDEADQDGRVLKTMKANYSKRGDQIKLRWEDGAFVTNGPQDAAQPAMGWPEIAATMAEVKRRWDSGDPWSSAPQTAREGRYLPLWMATMFGVTKREAAVMVEKWLVGGYLVSHVLDGRSKTRGLAVGKELRP